MAKKKRKSTGPKKNSAPLQPEGEQLENGCYQVEKILSHVQEKNGETYYVVKWVGWSSADNTEENEGHLLTVSTIRDYWIRAHPNKPATLGVRLMCELSRPSLRWVHANPAIFREVFAQIFLYLHGDWRIRTYADRKNRDMEIAKYHAQLANILPDTYPRIQIECNDDLACPPPIEYLQFHVTPRAFFQAHFHNLLSAVPSPKKLDVIGTRRQKARRELSVSTTWSRDSDASTIFTSTSTLTSSGGRRRSDRIRRFSSVGMDGSITSGEVTGSPSSGLAIVKEEPESDKEEEDDDSESTPRLQPSRGNYSAADMWEDVVVKGQTDTGGGDDSPLFSSPIVKQEPLSGDEEEEEEEREGRGLCGVVKREQQDESGVASAARGCGEHRLALRRGDTCWQLFSLSRIQHGHTIMHIGGDLINEREARACLRQETEMLAHYLIHLVDSDGSSVGWLDRRQRGDFSAYLDHSCTPSCRLVWRARGELFPRVELVACREICPGDALTIDMFVGCEADQSSDDPAPIYSQSLIRKAVDHVVCMCPSEECRGIVWRELLPDGFKGNKRDKLCKLSVSGHPISGIVCSRIDNDNQ